MTVNLRHPRPSLTHLQHNRPGPQRQPHQERQRRSTVRVAGNNEVLHAKTLTTPQTHEPVTGLVPASRCRAHRIPFRTRAPVRRYPRWRPSTVRAEISAKCCRRPRRWRPPRAAQPGTHPRRRTPGRACPRPGPLRSAARRPATRRSSTTTGPCPVESTDGKRIPSLVISTSNSSPGHRTSVSPHPTHSVDAGAKNTASSPATCYRSRHLRNSWLATTLSPNGSSWCPPCPKSRSCLGSSRRQARSRRRKPSAAVEPWWPTAQISADPSKREVAAVAALPGQSRMHPVRHTQSLL